MKIVVSRQTDTEIRASTISLNAMLYIFHMRLRILLLLALAFSSFPFSLIAQIQDTTKEQPNSSVYRDYRPPSASQMIRPSDVEYQLWEGLMLVRKANDGDPAAQHELGLQYLLGKGFPTDTVRAAYWIRRAADQNMPMAQYNLGVFVNNGWGVKWNPFEAYLLCKAAAQRNLPEAELALGLFYTDDLVVRRDWTKAYHWVKAAADAKYEPARQVLLEFIRRGLTPSSDSMSTPIQSAGNDTTSAGSVQSLEPVYINFGQDTTSRVDDLTLLDEAFHEGSEQFRKELGVSRIFENGMEKDSIGISMIKRSASTGSPEALAVLGRCYERGIGVTQNRVLAAEQYLRAARMDSRRAPALLLRLVQEKGFLEEVELRTRKGDDDAAFVWAGLVELGLDQRITNDQAFHLLLVAADHGNIPSLIELGRCYYTGQWTTRNPSSGELCWRRAASNGSRDAIIRLAAAAVLADSSTHSEGTSPDSIEQIPLTKDIHTLMTASTDGSMIGQLALGYCFEKGIGVIQNIPEAVKLYRNSAQRGSRSAYEALKRIYDSLRPKDKEFVVEDQNNEGDP